MIVQPAMTTPTKAKTPARLTAFKSKQRKHKDKPPTNRVAKTTRSTSDAGSPKVGFIKIVISKTATAKHPRLAKATAFLLTTSK